MIRNWHIKHKTDPKLHVWVSGYASLCETPELAIKLAQSCQECENAEEWDVIACSADFDEWNEYKNQFPRYTKEEYHAKFGECFLHKRRNRPSGS